MTRDEVNDGFDGPGDEIWPGYDKLCRCLTIMIWYLGVHVAFAAGTTVYLLILLFREGVF